MPPRYSYWTIIAGGLPTAFRAAERSELMPTFTRLREKHPDAEMKWFARGKLWDSPEAARQDTEERRRPRDEVRPGRRDMRVRRDTPGGGDTREGRGRPSSDRHDRSPSGRGGPSPDRRDRSSARNDRPSSDRRDRSLADRGGGPAGAPSDRQRDRNWRPGGEHRDPRQKFKDAKKAKNIRHRQEKFARKFGQGEWSPAQPERRPPPPKAEWRDSRAGGDRPPVSRPRPPKREWDEHRGPQKRAWSPPQERGPAGPVAPKRGWNEPRDGGKRDFRGPRAGGERPPQRSWSEQRDRRPAAPKRDWRPAGEGRPSSDRPRPPKREWDRPREESRGARKREWSPGPDRPRDEGRAPKGDWRAARNAGPPRGKRPFERRGFERNQGTEEPQPPPRPRGPNREPRPSETPEPGPPPRPNEPAVPPPGPPERGRLNKNKRGPR